MLKSLNSIESVITDKYRSGSVDINRLDGVSESEIKNAAKDMADDTDDVLFECWCRLVEMGGVKYLTGD